MKTVFKVLCLGILAGPIVNLSAHGHHDKKGIESYAHSIPGVGLISDTINFDGITIKKFHLGDDKKFVFVSPGQELSAHFGYEIDASKLETLHLHHFIIGLDNDGPQTCILHTLGITNSEGDTSCTLKAPEKPGVYQIRFCHAEGLTDAQAKDAWWRGDGPSAKTIVGIVVVK